METPDFRMLENLVSHRLNPFVPCVIRVDGRAFSKLTKEFDKPFDELFISVMDKVALDLAQFVDGCVLAYVQSDEVSLVLTPKSDPWFNWRVEKLTSVSASIATATFMNAMSNAAPVFATPSAVYAKAVGMKPYPSFDSRAFSIPANMVIDYLIWRQRDATRNAISQAAYHIVGAKATKNMRTSQMNEALFENGVNFDKYPPRIKRGAVVHSVTYVADAVNPITNEKVTCERRRWELDADTPIFSKNPEYLQEILKDKI